VDNPERKDKLTATLPEKLKEKARRIPAYLKRPLLAAVSITCVDALVLLLISGTSWRATLVLVLLLEGGLGLLAGAGVGLSSTPSISKVGETALGTAPWSREAERNSERVGLKWMLGSCLLIGIGFGVSLL